MEELDKAVTKKVYETIALKRNLFVMKVCTMCIFTNILFQAADFKNLMANENYFVLIYTWTLSIVCMSLASAFWLGKK